jgi:uncharacterized protein (TIGR02145 family)
MRKLLMTTAAVAAAIGVAVAGEPSFGTLTDTRDGQTYKTVKIGKQTWMARNLNYKMGKSWCYENKSVNCNKYGRLYAWNAAKKVCPDGYHLPSREEWIDLCQVIGGKKKLNDAGYIFWHGVSKELKAKCSWYIDGTDNYGFSALPGGSRYSDDRHFFDVGIEGIWWTATTENVGSNNYRLYVLSIYDNYEREYVREYNGNERSGFSVRCVADRP